MLKLVGMGPGSLKYATPEAIEQINAADRVIAFGRIAETAKEIRKDIKVVHKVEEAADMLEQGVSTVILASGDPCFYGILDFLQKNGIEVNEVITGISSVQYMMAKLKKSWHKAALLSLHGREEELLDIKDYKTAVILTDSKHTPGYISLCLKKNGLRGKLYTGFNLSYDDELITENRIGEEIEAVSPLALVVIENEMDQG